nr:MAG TPA: hypothetical protein [Caudoviricetes sp.]DAM85741.1 MAG TPA: hypothetical protein [Caudoviricetes sp.]
MLKIVTEDGKLIVSLACGHTWQRMEKAHPRH